MPQLVHLFSEKTTPAKWILEFLGIRGVNFYSKFRLGIVEFTTFILLTQKSLQHRKEKKNT